MTSIVQVFHLNCMMNLYAKNVANIFQQTFIKMHTKIMHPSRRSGKEKEAPMMQKNMDDK